MEPFEGEHCGIFYGRLVAPGTAGGVGVSPVSYDPVSGVVYVAGRHDPSIQTLVKVPNVPGGPALFKLVSKPVPPSQTWGTLTALDLTNGGHMLWQMKTPQPLVGGTLATAGGLVFTGEANGHFNAYDSATSKAPPRATCEPCVRNAGKIPKMLHEVF
jgi:glucose dehydrogenase